MTRLAMVIFSMVATTLAGTGVVIALVTGLDTLVPILAFAALGFVLAFPATWLIARKLAALG
ncbi:CTP synthetase [Pseudoruegeria sp. SHC-113]|uniref:CTP synthetase n=1 Tax=Pseudoruegeria sp. SHC-113 TaxID=2855439 RepID=UPI0021BAB911|nr:CTP synthetase [Pseudoruegeria sp. SHC-113]MCT8159074.1 CTP synthetase [Pseudoruegeria sp. SHC-113]